jgi:hypothetical protein
LPIRRFTQRLPARLSNRAQADSSEAVPSSPNPATTTRYEMSFATDPPVRMSTPGGSTLLDTTVTGPESAGLVVTRVYWYAGVMRIVNGV